MQVYSLLHPNAPAKRTQAGQVCVHRSKIGLSMSHLASSARSFSASATKGLQRRGSLRRCRPTLQAGARDMEKSPRARSPRCRAIGEQPGRPVSRPGSLRRCRATLQAGAGVNTRAEGEYPQFLDAFCLGLKEFGSTRFCAGACDQRRIDRADWRGHGHYGRIMTTELEPPAPLPFHSRAPAGAKNGCL